MADSADYSGIATAVNRVRSQVRWKSNEGVMESAFVVDRPEHYLSKPGFEWIGLLGGVLDEL